MYGHVLPGWQQIAADTFVDAMDGADGAYNTKEEDIEHGIA